MIKNLRKKFTIVAMCSMFLVLATIMTGLNIANYMGISNDADHLLDMIAGNDGTFPQPPSESEPKETKTSENTEKKEIPVKPEETDTETPPPKPEDNRKNPMDAPNGDGQKELQKNNTPPDGITAESPYNTRFFTVWLDEKGNVLKTHLDNIAAITETQAKNYAKTIYQSGKTKGFQDIYRYRKSFTDTGYMIIFLDRQSELNTFKNNLLTSVTASAAGLFAVFILVMFFSKMVNIIY